ncbi:MAG: helix-turn-helix domain-containing protein [Rhizobiaceae bacterium]
MTPATAEKLDFPAENAHSVGNDIRALRKSRSMTLVDFSDALNRSVGFVSQIERGISEPSIADLRNIANLFDVPISFFFGENTGSPSESRHIVRAGHRRKLGNPEAGLIEELLSPDLGGSFEIIRSEFAPGAKLDGVQQRDTEEAGYIISGTLDLELNGVWHTLDEGDSFRFAGEPHRWHNKQDTSAIVIWVISPPVY